MTTSLSAELIETARSKCNESPEKTKTKISKLREWIKRSPHLRVRTNKKLLLAFLRCSKFGLEETKHRIDAYYSFKSLFPEVLTQREVSDSLLELLHMGVHIIPKEPISSTGPRLMISRYSKYDPKKFLLRDIFKLFFMLLEILALEDHNATISGLVYVIDARDVSMELLKQLEPLFIRKVCMLLKHGAPVRIHQLHIINMRRESQAVFDHISSFLLPKMPFQCFVHQRAEDLYQHLPRDAMFIEFGGHNGFAEEAVKSWHKKLRDYQKYFAEDDKFGTNEKLRPGLKNIWNMTDELGGGISGSFRKIEID